MIGFKKGDKNKKDFFLNEFRLSKSIDSPHVLTCHEVFLTETEVQAVTEYMKGGSLDRMVPKSSFLCKKSGRLSVNSCRYVLSCVAKGLAAMHLRKNKILHRDIKLANIVMSDNGEIKLIDLGYAVSLSQERNYRKTSCGTTLSLSPELLDRQPYSTEVDIWAFGIVAYQLAMIDVPYHNIETNINWLMSVMTKGDDERTLDISDMHPAEPEFQDLIDRCL